MERKFAKIRDVSYILKTLNTAEIITSSQLTKQQKILVDFQRVNVIQGMDISDDSDQIDDFFYSAKPEENSPIPLQRQKTLEELNF